MDRTKRLRRAGILCSSFVRNYAYYTAGWNGADFKVNSDFGSTINGNFLDLCVLEWGKLFGSKKDHHHWRRVVNNGEEFKERMFSMLGKNQNDLNAIHNSMKTYRDKFVAHLDSEETMNIPNVSNALPFVNFYYCEIQKECTHMTGLPKDIEEYFNGCTANANSYYEKMS